MFESCLCERIHSLCLESFLEYIENFPEQIISVIISVINHMIEYKALLFSGLSKIVMQFWKLFFLRDKFHIVWIVFHSFWKLYQSKWSFSRLSRILMCVWKLFLLKKKNQIVWKVFQNFWKLLSRKWVFLQTI